MAVDFEAIVKVLMAKAGISIAEIPNDVLEEVGVEMLLVVNNKKGITSLLLIEAEAAKNDRPN